uniref:Uncharacterized protein n=1 Tax=Clytia hemisphaerica TaxID=252671 RepID=A0A7M5XCA8_9CNID
MYTISKYFSVVSWYTIYIFAFGLGGVIYGFILYPLQTGIVHAVYVAFHLCDVMLVYLFHKVFEKTIYRLRFLSAEFCVSLLVASLQTSVVATTWFTTWAVLSFVHCFIFIVILLSSDENNVYWRTLVNRQISTRPEIITYCEVIEPKAYFWSSKEVIWREEKVFEYDYWIDLTDSSKIGKFQAAWMVRVDFDIQFDDEETENLYQEHVKTMLHELPEYCKNATKVTKTIMKIEGKSVDEIQLYYNWPKILQVLIFHIGRLVKLYSWIFKKLCANLFTTRIVITKVISNKNIEVIC